jgi:subtilisin family serine protease
VPNDTKFPEQDALFACGFPDAWEFVGEPTRPVSVAIVDTGVFQAHDDLPATQFEAFQFSRVDPFGHGTAVAGILGATRDNGIGIAGAIRCNMTVYRVFDDAHQLHSGAYHSALEMIAASDAKVVNLSIMGESDDPDERRLVSACLLSGKTVVAAMGNVGQASSADAVIYPAALDGVIGVGSVDGNGRRESYSIRGDHICISAPGTSIWTTKEDGGYGQMTGTSFATPLVAAACVLLYQRWPAITPAQVKAALSRLVDPADEARGWNRETGHGRLNIGRIRTLPDPTKH